MSVDARFLADENVPIVTLAIGDHFARLTPKEQRYAHHIGRASWAGARIIMAQTCESAPLLCDMFLAAFRSDDSSTLRDMKAYQIASQLTDSDFKAFLEYAVQVLANLSPFKSFGDTLFIPRVPRDSFVKAIGASGSKAAVDLCVLLIGRIYAVEPSGQTQLGFPAQGHVSGYYSSNVDKSDIERVQSLLDTSNVSALNTRLFKLSANQFELRIASADEKQGATLKDAATGLTVKIVYGDFKSSMVEIVKEMKQAVTFAANDNQRAMCECYVKSFQSGSIEDHRQSQINWIKDQGPNVESNVGFIETYRDPAGIRAEWEGFVAVVNQEMTKKFGVLVDNAERFIAMLPWPTAFEKDTFMRPDFTSLEVVNFATGGLPAGINIPNYDDIRQTIGFKNVSLGNVLSAHSPSEKVFFLSDEDVILFTKYRGPAFEVQVGLHELLGHGSGKLLQEDPAGVFNFDVKSPPDNPLDKKPVSTWYKPGETWGSVFKGPSCSYEECRAEAVAMHLITNDTVLKIFGHEGQEAADILYIGYLSMAKAGLSALEFFDPKTSKWGQAHMQARWALLRLFLAADLATIVPDLLNNDLRLTLHRDRILSHGAPAVADFLQSLQVYKATADFTRGTTFYANATAVSSDWYPIRDIVLLRKQPRKVFVQCNTSLSKEGTIILKEYPSTLHGVLQSYIERKL